MGDITIAADIITGFQEVLEEVGVPGKLRYFVSTGTEYNPTLTPTDENITLIDTGYKLKEIDGTTIQSGDRKFLFISTRFPQTADQVVIDGVVYNIGIVEKVAVSGVTVLYKVQGRK